MNSTSKVTPISAFLVTHNEARHIGAVLDALQVFDEIVLVDSGSTDGTVDIAKSKGARVVMQPWLGFARQKEFALELCRNQWVINVDGDEIVPAVLATEIQQRVDDGKAEAMRLYFEDVFWSEPMSPYSAKRSIVRVFKKGNASYPLDRRVHENLKLSSDAREITVPGLVTHFGYATTEKLMSKQNQYSSLKAQEKFDKGRKPSLLKLSLIFPLTFIKSYFLQRMFLSGKRGLVYAHIEAMYAFLKEAKLFELSQAKHRDEH